MALQTVINGRQTPGFAGEFSDTSIKAAREYLVYGKDDTSKPTFGKFFSLKDKALDTGSSDKTTVAVQGVADDSWAVGILVNPKEHYTHGFVTTLQMDAGAAGTIATRGHIYVMTTTETVAGEPVYVDADGNVGSSDLANGKKLIGAKWLKSVVLGNNVEVLSEVEIDAPTVEGETGPTTNVAADAETKGE
jgi:hypothetical protein